MKKILDIAQWERKDHFHFFKQFEEPFFGITAQVDCTNAYAFAKEKQYRFFLYYLYLSLVAANATRSFRFRIEEDQVVEYEVVHASPTINRPNGTFGFSYIQYQEDIAVFMKDALTEIERVQSGTGLELAASNDNIIHFSSIPWISFTALSHARSFSFKDCIPKIAFGKMTETNNRKWMPVSIHAHHALMDGYHVAAFLDAFQLLLNKE